MKIFFCKDRRKAWTDLRQRCSVGGITYIFLPTIMAIMGNIFSAAGGVWRLPSKRKKQELPLGGNPFCRTLELNDGHTLLPGAGQMAAWKIFWMLYQKNGKNFSVMDRSVEGQTKY